jgi:signal transduction histidine kinase
MNVAKPLHPVTLVSLAGIPAAALVGFAAMQGGVDRYLPHGVCYAWQPGLIRLHLVSDVLIGLAYLAIPVALVHFIRRRTDIPFNWMFLLFGLFIVACGATHWMEVLTLWNPVYWVAGTVKAITAAASVPTAILLFMLIPKAVALPSIAQLEAAKAALEREVAQRREAEAALEEARRDLERRVEDRTSELRVANGLLERQREELAQADRAKGNFLAILSHELRNPVHAIRMNARVIGAKAVEPAFASAANAIERQVAKLANLLEELLDLVSLSRKTSFRMTAADVTRAVEGAIETTRADMYARRQAVALAAEDGPFTAMLDSARFEQALTNVLVNASKYSPEGSRIDVGIVREKETIVVCVRDFGIGITDEEMPRLFELFGRGNGARHAGADGLGIGLYIAHEIVVAHGGRISARSDGRGHGCEFRIVLPAAPVASVVASERRPERGFAEPRNALRVLVVDDNKDAADSVAENLRLSGHEVAVAYDGGKAVDGALAFRPDVAVIDIGLPVMNGYQVAETLRVSPDPPAMIALTGWGTEQDKGDALRAGFARHLTKPVDFDDLVALVLELGLPVRARRT